jgi:hypothetical protein
MTLPIVLLTGKLYGHNGGRSTDRPDFAVSADLDASGFSGGADATRKVRGFLGQKSGFSATFLGLALFPGIEAA